VSVPTAEVEWRPLGEVKRDGKCTHGTTAMRGRLASRADDRSKLQRSEPWVCIALSHHLSLQQDHLPDFGTGPALQEVDTRREASGAVWSTMQFQCNASRYVEERKADRRTCT
jgi:hypothetical protein